MSLRKEKALWGHGPRTKAKTMLLYLPFHKGINSRRTQLQQVLDVFDPNVNFTRGRILGTCHLGEDKNCHASPYNSQQSDRLPLQGPEGAATRLLCVLTPSRAPHPSAWVPQHYYQPRHTCSCRRLPTQCAGAALKQERRRNFWANPALCLPHSKGGCVLLPPHHSTPQCPQCS